MACAVIAAIADEHRGRHRARLPRRSSFILIKASKKVAFRATKELKMAV
jgi:nucleoid DNA-binding protein